MSVQQRRFKCIIKNLKGFAAVFHFLTTTQNALAAKLYSSLKCSSGKVLTGDALESINTERLKATKKAQQQP